MASSSVCLIAGRRYWHSAQEASCSDYDRPLRVVIRDEPVALKVRSRPRFSPNYAHCILDHCLATLNHSCALLKKHVVAIRNHSNPCACQLLYMFPLCRAVVSSQLQRDLNPMAENFVELVKECFPSSNMLSTGSPAFAVRFRSSSDCCGKFAQL